MNVPRLNTSQGELFKTDFLFAASVIIDGDRDLVGHVTGFQFRYGGYQIIEVSWMHNGISQSGWFEPWRLKMVGT